MAHAQFVSEVWSPDNGDGTYTNPVINADYSDPDVCVGASGEDYYLTASSFQCVPGLPILHSKDLVNWEIINHALGNLYEGDEELLIGATLGIPSEAVDVRDSLVERTQLIEFGKRLLHQFGVLTEQLALV